MDTFPTLSTSSYNTIRSHICSGDILLCSGNAVFSKLIQEATQSVWSHVGFILRLDIIDRIFVLESVESIGVRAIPLSNYVCDYNGTGSGYEGRLMLARHQEVKQDNIPKLSRTAVDLLGFPYGKNEIASIAARIGMMSVGVPNPGAAHCDNERTFICSEYAHVCFESIGVTIPYNPQGFITPADFARDPKVKAISYIETVAATNTAAA